MTTPSLHIVSCNGATSGRAEAVDGTLALEYRNLPGRNVKLNLPDFVRSVSFMPPRILDLIEIAAYIHAGDRMVGRGASDAVELHGWQRRFLYRIRVRDHEFWSRTDVMKALSEVVNRPRFAGDQIT